DFEAEADAIERAEAKEDERMTEAILSGAPVREPRMPAGSSGLQSDGSGAPPFYRVNAYDVKFARDAATDARISHRNGTATRAEMEQAERRLSELERAYALELFGRAP